MKLLSGCNVSCYMLSRSNYSLLYVVTKRTQAP